MSARAYDRSILDNFNDNVMAGNWFNWSGGQAVETNSRLEITYPGTTNNQWGVDNTNDVSVLEQYYGAQLVQAPNQETTNRRVTPILIQTSSGNTFSWRVSGGLANCWLQVGGASSVQQGSSLTYNPAVHKYFVAGINAANQVQWMWSTDGIHFTVHATASNPYGTTLANSMTMYCIQTATVAGAATIILDDWSVWTPRPLKVKVRYGGAWVLATPKVRIGGAWVTAVPKARSGGAWVDAY